MTLGDRLERRSGWFAVALVGLFTAGASARWWLISRTPGGSAGFSEDHGLMVAFLAYALLGALMVWKRPRHPVGWMTATVGLVVSVCPALESYAAHRMLVVGEPDALATFGVWLNGLYWMPLLTLVLVYVPLLFPDGRLPSPRWRWLTRLVTASLVALVVPSMFVERLEGQDLPYVIANPIGVAGAGALQESAIFGLLAGAILVGVIGALASLVVRFRRSHGVERQQIKWLILAVAPGPFVPLAEGLGTFGFVVFLLNLVGIPLAITFAVLRYRLYDVDRIISRTVGYVLVSAVLVGIYVTGVLSLGAVGRTATGEVNDLVVALSTLLVAAAFQPVRRRIQSTVDRRFNRRRYDAAQLNERFAQRLRDQVDLTELRGDLSSTVRHAVAPATISVWLPQEGGR